jgi:hypothetical protein
VSASDAEYLVDLFINADPNWSAYDSSEICRGDVAVLAKISNISLRVQSNFSKRNILTLYTKPIGEL